jgi:alkylated DNA repair dioxygenase AlkB
MKATKLIDNIYLIEDILDIDNYPNIFNSVKVEANFDKPGRGGRKMCRMTDKGIPYTLFGKKYGRKNYTETVLRIKKELEEKLPVNADYFNTCTLNYYNSGNCSFRDHTDKMPDLEQPMIVATLTLGNSNRKMRLINRFTNIGYEVVLKHNSMLFMGPGMQDIYLHGIPKEENDVEPRLSLSFRRQKL